MDARTITDFMAAGALPALDAARAVREVPEPLFRRHAGLPADPPAEPVVEEILAGARERYARTCAPWCAASRRTIEEIRGDLVTLDGGRRISSAGLAGRLAAAGARGLVVVGASAGEAATEEIERLWRAERPAEAMVLHAFSVAVVEHLRERWADLLARRLEPLGWRVLPWLSPGHEGWDLAAGQAALLECLDGPGPLRVLASGALRPSRSTLAALGVAPAGGGDAGTESATERAPAPPAAAHAPIPERALEKWSRERLRTSPSAGGGILAVFRFDGTTCSSLGMPIAMEYSVELRPDAAGRLEIAACSARPAEGDQGHRWMCAFREDPRLLGEEIRSGPPVAGRRIEDIGSWAPQVRMSGCLCSAADRAHKWKMVLETVRWALRSRAPGEGRDS